MPDTPAKERLANHYAWSQHEFKGERMSDEAPSVLFHEEAGTGFITLNRPERLNAFDAGMARTWARVTRDAVSDPAVRAIVLQAEGRSFCAGGDVRAMAGSASADRIESLAGIINEGILALVNSNVPVVAAVHGTTVGGGLGILLASDYAVASVDSRIGSLYAEMGLTPDLSVTAQLAAAIGERRALQLVLTARLLSADEALDWGIVAEVTDPGAVRARAAAVAQSIVEGAADAYGEAKRLIRTRRNRTFEAQLAEEAHSISAAVSTPDAQARIAAFAAKGSTR